MNREIKFRRWDKNFKKMIEVVDTPAWKLRENDLFVYMEFSGLYDKNLREIYEGDIVRGIGVNSEIKHVVTMHSFCGWPHIDAKDFEIIGNVFENPELLK